LLHGLPLEKVCRWLREQPGGADGFQRAASHIFQAYVFSAHSCWDDLLRVALEAKLAQQDGSSIRFRYNGLLQFLIGPSNFDDDIDSLAER
jgi:hypothetical protein